MRGRRILGRGGRCRAKQAVSPKWERWVLENLASGVSDATVVDALVSHGVPSFLARTCVRRAHDNGGVDLLRRAAAKREQCQAILRLQDAHRLRTIRRTPLPDAESFYRDYWATSTPAIFTDWVDRWPAMNRWTPDDFAKRFGDVEIEACTGRDADPTPDINFPAHARTMTMRAYVEQLAKKGSSNDLYLIANNRNTARPGLRPLFDDLILPDGFFDAPHVPTSSALWFGAAGTVTQLHHDTSNIMFCQVLGSKRFWLAPPTELSVLEASDGVYNRLHPEQSDDDRFVSVDVLPGEALFIPVGWWHAVRALDLSISIALNGFCRPNCFPWFKPGEL